MVAPGGGFGTPGLAGRDPFLQTPAWEIPSFHLQEVGLSPGMGSGTSRHRGRLRPWAPAGGTGGDRPRAHAQGRMERPNGGKAALYLDTSITRPAKTSLGFAPRPLGLLKLPDLGFLRFLNNEEIPRAPPAAEIINNLSKPTTRRPFSLRRAPPRSSPRRPQLSGSAGYGSAIGSAGNRFALPDLYARASPLIRFDPGLPASQRSGGGRMAAGDRLGRGRGRRARSRGCSGRATRADSRLPRDAGTRAGRCLGGEEKTGLKG